MEHYYSLGIYDYNREKICDLYDSQVELIGQAYQIIHSENIDGYRTLEFDIPRVIEDTSDIRSMGGAAALYGTAIFGYSRFGETDIAALDIGKNFRWDYLKSDYLIRYTCDGKNEWFVANKPSRAKAGKSIVGHVSCNGAESLLKTKSIYVSFDDENGIGTAGYLMEQILKGTGWEYDTQSDTLYESDGTTEKVRSLISSEKKGALELISMVCKLFCARPVFDTDQKKVKILDINNREQVLEGEVGRNLNALTVNNDSSNMCTRVYIEGEYGDYGYVGIDDVKVDRYGNPDDEGEPWGLPFLVNFDYYRELGIFKQEHENALDTYLTDIRRIKGEIREEGAVLTACEDELNALVGQCKFAVFYKSHGYTEPARTYGFPANTTTTLNEGDSVVILKDDHTHTYEEWADNPSSQMRNAYGVVKFITKAAGKIGAAEVHVESKQKTIAQLEYKISSTTRQEKIDEYNAEIEKLNNEIQIIYLGNNDDDEGLYSMMYRVMKEDGLLYDLDEILDELGLMNDEQDGIEETFANAMGHLLRDGSWSDNNYIPGQEKCLYADAIEITKEMSRPKREYTFDYVRLTDEFDIDIEDIEINGTFHVYDKEIQVDEDLYIKRISHGVDNKSLGTIEVGTPDRVLTGGNFSDLIGKITELANMLNQNSTVYDRAKAINKEGLLDIGSLTGDFDVSKFNFYSSTGDWSIDSSGRFVFGGGGGGGSVRFGGDGLDVATTKDEDGNWDYHNVLDGDGINADDVNRGFLDYERLDPSTGSRINISGNSTVGAINASICVINSAVCVIDSNVAIISSGVAIVNSNINTLNSNISIVNSNINTVNSNINTINSNINTVNSNINTVNSNINTINSNINTVNSNINTVNSNINTINSNINTINSNINIVNSSVNTINSTVNIVNSTVNTVNSLINTVDSLVNTVNSSINTVDSLVNTVSSSISTINSNINTINSNISTINSNITTINTNISAVNFALSVVNTNIETQDFKFEGINSNITAINTDISTLNLSVNSINTTISTQDFKFEGVNSSIAAINTNIETVNTNISTLNLAVNAINTDISTQNFKFDGINSSITAINADISAINSQVTTINTIVYADNASICIINTHISAVDEVLIAHAARINTIETTYLSAENMEGWDLKVASIDAYDIHVMNYDSDGDLSCMEIDCSAIKTGDITAAGDISASNFILSGNSFDNVIVSASLSNDGKILTLTPLVGNPINFSKATSGTVAGNWGSATFTVTGAENELATHLTNTGHWGNASNGEDPLIYYYKTFATINTSPTPYDTGNHTEINASSIHAAGYSSAQLVGTWDERTLTITKSTSGSTSLTYSVTAGHSITYNSTTHTYSGDCLARVNATTRNTLPYDSGDQAYQDGLTTGSNNVKLAGTWSGRTLTITKSTSGNDSLTYSLTAGHSITYNSTTHTYSGTCNANAAGSTRSTLNYDSGDQAYQDGNTAGYGSAKLVGTWDGRTLTVAKSTTGDASLTYSVTAGHSITYNSTSHKYTGTCNANVNATTRNTLNFDSGDQAYTDGQTAGANSVSISSIAVYGSPAASASSITVRATATNGKTKDEAINITTQRNNAYASGWAGCYGGVQLDSTAAKTLGYGSSITVYAQAFSTSGATSRTNVQSRTITAPADRNVTASITYNSTSHKYTAAAYKDGASASTKASGTEAYDAGKSAVAVTAGITYNSTSHKYVASAYKDGASASTTSSGTEAFDAGVSSVTVTAGIQYNSTTHKYTAKAYKGSAEASAIAGGTEAYTAGINAYWNSSLWGSTVQYNTTSKTYYITIPNQALTSGTAWTVNANKPYTDGQTAGKNSVTVSSIAVYGSPAATASAITVRATASNGQTKDESINITTQRNNAYSSGYTVGYSAGVTAGKSAVTVTAGCTYNSTLKKYVATAYKDNVAASTKAGDAISVALTAFSYDSATHTYSITASSYAGNAVTDTESATTDGTAYEVGYYKGMDDYVGTTANWNSTVQYDSSNGYYIQRPNSNNTGPEVYTVDATAPYTAGAQSVSVSNVVVNGVNKFGNTYYINVWVSLSNGAASTQVCTYTE